MISSGHYTVADSPGVVETRYWGRAGTVTDMSPIPPAHVRVDDAPDDEQIVAELTGLLAATSGIAELADRMTLLSDERRLRILFCLHAHPGVRSSDVARATGALDSTTSHALALLRDAGWVRALRSGREVRYELADPVIHELLHSLGSDHLPGVHHAPGSADSDAGGADRAGGSDRAGGADRADGAAHHR